LRVTTPRGMAQAARCTMCARAFGSPEALAQHCRDKRHSAPAPPLPGLEGKWVARAAFDGRKSFGRYLCLTCGNKRWLSAHAFPKYAQRCKACETACLPLWLWQNTGNHQGERSKPGKPHDAGRCGACAAGVCAR
jgi:hypothetical protein